MKIFERIQSRDTEQKNYREKKLKTQANSLFSGPIYLSFLFLSYIRSLSKNAKWLFEKGARIAQSKLWGRHLRLANIEFWRGLSKLIYLLTILIEPIKYFFRRWSDEVRRDCWSVCFSILCNLSHLANGSWQIIYLTNSNGKEKDFR